MSNLLVRLIGWRAALIHGEPLVLDRWKFLKCHMPRVKDTEEQVLEVGCGTGAFSMGLASRGYQVIGLSWDENNQNTAQERARLSGLKNVEFPIGDARRLHEETGYREAFDVVVCCEVIEHIFKDKKLMLDMYNCLKPGGRLLLTTPNHYYRSTWNDAGPWSKEEDGGHVRRGYTPSMLRELCREAGFEVEELSTTSQFFSQVTSRLQRRMHLFLHQNVVWLLTVPLRMIPPVLDGWLGRLMGAALSWPGYSLTLVAYKSRFN